MIKGFVYLDKVRSQEEFDQLVELSAKDKHGVFMPTFSIKRHGDPTMIGWISVGTEDVPIIFGWFSMTEMGARDSFTILNQIENLLALKGSRAVCLPMPQNSPFYPLMESMGYAKGGDYTFFVKKLT